MKTILKMMLIVPIAIGMLFSCSTEQVIQKSLLLGYNRAGEFPLSLAEIVKSLVITSVDLNPEFIKWDLSAFGYHNFTFHVFLYNKTLSDGYGYTQTTTYGEFGFHTKDRIILGDDYEMDFTNLGPDCTPVKVTFKLQ